MSAELSPEDLKQRLASPDPPLVIDVRKPAAVRAEPRTIPGAIWRSPFEIASWSGELPEGRAVVVYCAHGHEVSHGARDALLRQGFAASLLSGGLDAWQASGGELAATADQP